MTLRLAQGVAHPRSTSAALAGIALLSLLLAGCASAFLADDGPGAGPAPAPSATATPTAEPPVDPAPEPDFDCDDILINRPGNYVLGNCGTVTLEGSGIDLTFTSIAHLVIRGDRADLVGGELGTVEIEGQANELAVLTAGAVTIRGEDNILEAEETIESVVLNGNGNVVTAGEGIGAVVDNGLLNEVG